MKRLGFVMIFLLMFLASSTLISRGGVEAAASKTFQIRIGVTHAENVQRNTKVSTNITVNNRSTNKTIELTNVQFIRRDTGADVTDLAGIRCLFNINASLPEKFELPVTLQPEGGGI